MIKMKTPIGIFLSLAMLMSLLVGLSPMTVLAFDTGVTVEAEAGILANSMRTHQSPTAGGGICIGDNTSSMQTNPGGLVSPDASYSFTITTAGSYKIYVRGYAPNSSSDSFWYRWDGAAYTQAGVVNSTQWSWHETAAATLSAGTHTLDICHRELGYYMDLIVLSTGLTQTQKNAIDAGISPSGNASTATTFNTTSGAVMFEAENATLDTALFGVTADSSASNGNVVTALVRQNTAPSNTVSGIEFNIMPDRSAAYDIWLRYSAISGSQDSLYLSYNNGDYVNTGVAITGTDPSVYGWRKISTTSTQLYAGGKYNYKIYPREPGLRIDKIVVTAYPFFTPTGEVTTLDNTGFNYTLSSTYPTPTILPPSAHPRLLFQSTDISGIQANMAKTQDASALTAYNNYLASSVNGSLSTVITSTPNYNATVLATLEAYALKYALDGDATYGNKAVTGIKNYFSTIILDDAAKDITRTMGHMIFVASEIYDWCYPLLSEADKSAMIAACEAMASRMEIGYPPSGQGAVVSHGGEAQLFRDLLSLGIATYNERPDIYNFVAGRLLSQFIQPRNYWYASNTHYQGDSYGPYRYTWETVFQFLMKRMSGNTMFDPASQYVPYQWIYTRRPDGQFFRNGDCAQEVYLNTGVYSKWDRESLFYSSNFYGNGFIKQQYIAEDPSLNTFTVANGDLSPVSFLLLNNPDLAGVSHTTTFPLTKYFGRPYGMMVARTGWTEPGSVNKGANVAMAQMVIGEQWSGNHQHLDAGSFQLYYKGALASESGVYDSYGSTHDNNYNKETIAHNALLIKDPNETMYSGYSIANSGGQRRPGDEPATFSQWMSGGYDTGTVLDQAYDTQNTIPQYSYIKGDITRAYSSKVSEVLRSMMFLPLQDTGHPAAFIVMDKVTSTNAAFKKTWLLHTQQDFTISGNTAVVKRNTDGYNGRMDLTTLLPANATLTKVGGTGHEYDINGTNFAPSKSVATSCERGAYRLEVSPPSANTTDYFLNVMQVSNASDNLTPLTATLIENDSVVGAKLSDRVAIFGRNKNRMAETVSFEVPGSEASGLKFTVAGIGEGSWNVYRNSTLLCTASATVNGGVLSFDGGVGSYSLVQSNLAVHPANRASSQSLFAPLTVVSDSTAPSGSYIYASGYNSMSTAPATGQAVYTFGMPSSGDATVYVNALAPDGASDSYWYKIDNGAWNIRYAPTTSSNWQSIPHSITGLSAGTHTFSIAYREGNTKFDSISINRMGAEAECASLQSSFSPFTVVNDTAAGGGKCICAPGYNSMATAPATGQATYSFNLASAADVDLYATVLAPDETSDSFWYKIDNGSWEIWTAPSINNRWQLIAQSVSGLASGAHTLTIAYREGNMKLDKISICPR